jgi:hypothetical protein
VLYGVECDCCYELATGGVATWCDDPDAAGGDEPSIAPDCPPCTAVELCFRPEVAQTSICAWEPLPAETSHTHGDMV